MKKVTVLSFALILLGATCVFAAPSNTQKITNTRTVQATKDTTLTYGKVKFFVPAGQDVELSQAENGIVMLRADKMEGVQAGKATLSAQSPVVLSIDPKTNVVVVEQGNTLQLVDANGRTVEASQGAAVSGEDVRQPAARSWMVTLPLSWQADRYTATINNTPKNVNATVSNEEMFPDYVAQEEIDALKSDQAVRDVEDTLSPSAPRQ